MKPSLVSSNPDGIILLAFTLKLFLISSIRAVGKIIVRSPTDIVKLKNKDLSDL